jgi:hypothetical protein
MRFSLETIHERRIFGQLWRQDLNDHDPVHTRLITLIHIRHAARTYQGLSLIGAKFFANMVFQGAISYHGPGDSRQATVIPWPRLGANKLRRTHVIGVNKFV